MCGLRSSLPLASLVLSEEGITSPGLLSQEKIEKMEAEVVKKRMTELEEICQNAHIEPDVSTALNKLML
uniref:Uncharacterized protein n=1 Tax=Setaria viridis TaxID=4556 RepID=A0A4U6UDC1_SETVI|nr:hypothetical protein SEVIR_6G245100v2 [Setaria viridis]